MSSFVTDNVSESKTEEQHQQIKEQQRQPQVTNKNGENIKEKSTTNSQIQKETIATVINNENNVNETEGNNEKILYEGKCEESENNPTKQTTTTEKITTVQYDDDKSYVVVVASDEDKTIETLVVADNNKNLNNTSDNKLTITQTSKSATVLATATCSDLIMLPSDAEQHHQVQEEQVASLDNNLQSGNLSIAGKSAPLTSNEESLKTTTTESLTCEKSEIKAINTLTTFNKETSSVPKVITVASSIATPLISPLPPLPPGLISQLPHISSEPSFGVQLRCKNTDDKKNNCNNSNTSAAYNSSVIKTGTVSASASPNMVRKTSDSSVLLPRRVSFPKSDNELVTGYLEPANPWEHVFMVKSISEIAELYTASCQKHNTKPLQSILDHLKAVDLTKQIRRQPLLSLKSIKLAPSDCEALEEVLKRVQYKSIDLSDCELDETAASALFDMIEYYEATNELDISSNAMGMTNRGWTSCIYMISHSRELQVLNAEGNPISKQSADHLGNALITSNLHTLKLEHCGLKGAPLSGLCFKLWHNKVLKELWLAYNDLDCNDADTIAEMLKSNHYLELIDISNNNIRDEGLRHIVKALIMQSKELERRTTFQRTTAIDDDGDNMSPVECSPLVDLDDSNEATLDWNTKETQIESSSAIPPIESNIVKESLPSIEEKDKCTEPETRSNAHVESEHHKVKPPLISSVGSTIDETDGDEDTDDTVRSSTIKIALPTSSGGQSMLDKLLSMNSESSSEDGASNLSTDTLAACNSEDASLISDEIFDASATTTTITSTNTKSPANKIHEVTSLTEAMVTVTSAIVNPTTATSALTDERLNEGEMTKILQSSPQKIDLIDQNNVTLNDIVNAAIISPLNNMADTVGMQSSHIINNNVKNNNENNVTSQTMNIPLSTAQMVSSQTLPNITEDENLTGTGVFEVKAEESDCLLSNATRVAISDDSGINSGDQSNVMQNHTASKALDVNKNTKLTEDFDDTHSTDSAFESASEGDISRHLPDEFTRLSTSLESTRFDEIAKELAIETATIASESNECLIAAVAQITPSSTPTPPTPPFTNLSTPLTERDRLTPESPINSCLSSSLPTVTYTTPPIVQVSFTSSEDSTGSLKVAANEVRDKMPKVTIAQDSLTQKYKSNSAISASPSQIPTPPPPSTSPGGASSGLRRTETSCGFLTQSSRNRSQSTDSLCSDNSLDGSIGSGDLNFSSPSQLNEKVTKNDTLTRQSRPIEVTPEFGTRSPGGLKALAVWNNNLTKESGLYISDLLAETVSLELLNIGKNCLSNEFVSSIKESLTKNTTLTTLGLQSAHLSAKGIETLSSILTFGGNSTLQRIDIRDNKLEVESLSKIAEVLKSNTTVTQIDIDDEPKRLSIGSEAHLDYARILENVRSMCARNEKTQTQMQQEKSSANAMAKRRGGYYLGSRKISLTCQSRPVVDVSKNVVLAAANSKLDIKRKAGTRLRSPVPSPTTISPSSSPNRTSRFQVCRVPESSPLTSPNTQKLVGSNLVATKSFSVSTAAIPLSSATEKACDVSNYPCSTSASLPTSCSLPSMATISSSTQSIKRLSVSPRSRFLVRKVYEDPHLSLATSYTKPITPPINPPPTPISRKAKDSMTSGFLESTSSATSQSYQETTSDDIQQSLSKGTSTSTVDTAPTATFLTPPTIITPQQQQMTSTTTDIDNKTITTTPIMEFNTPTTVSSSATVQECEKSMNNTMTTTSNINNHTQPTATQHTKSNLTQSTDCDNLQPSPSILSTLSTLSSSSSETSSSSSSSSSTSPASNTDSTDSSSSPGSSVYTNEVLNQNNPDLTLTAQCPIAVFSDNDITLTKNTVNEVFGTAATSVAKESVDTSNENTITPSTLHQKEQQQQQQHQQRVRKVSWISNPTAVDKLLTLFHNPTNLFQRSSSPESRAVSNPTTTVASNLSQSPPTYAEAAAAGAIISAEQQKSQTSLVPLRKPSPPSWTKLGNDIINAAATNNADLANTVATTAAAVVTEQSRSFFDAASKQFRDFSKQVFRQNLSFGNEAITTASTSTTLMTTATVQNPEATANENIAGIDDYYGCGCIANTSGCLCGSNASNTEYDVDCIPTDVNQEIKENISPEHTINEETLHTMQKLYGASETAPLNFDINKDNVDWANTFDTTSKMAEGTVEAIQQTASTAPITQITQSIVATKSGVENELPAHNT